MVKVMFICYGNICRSTMADINPFRYRGYYYDTETGFYYLQTRYYDPTTRLFINADNYELISTLAETLGQLNMYGYCNNNPIMFTDESGESFVVSLLVGFFVGSLLGGTIGGIKASIQGENVWGGILSGALIGGVLGAATITGAATMFAIGGKAVAGFVTASTLGAKASLLAASAGLTAASSFAAGVGAYAIQTSFNGRQFNLNEALSKGATTMVKGLTNFTIGMSVALGGGYNYLLKGAPTRTFTRMIIDGVGNAVVSNLLKILQQPWYYML